MNFLIIEDEIPAQRLIQELVQELRPDWHSLACLDSVESALDWLSRNSHPEIIFMDIQLSDGLSFEILSQMAIESMIIFTTAYDEYAVRAFKVNSIDYLLKPIKKSDLASALDKYDRYQRQMFVQRNQAVDVPALLEALHTAKPKYRSRFLISLGETYVPLLIEKVAYIFSRNRITSAMTFENKRHMVDFTLDDLEEQLDPAVFFRVSRQFIVHLHAVSRVNTFFNGKLILETRPAFDEKITISREKARLFKSWLDR